MLRRLITNTAFNIAAFVVAGVVGILLTPLIVRSWGLAEFGLIVLVRTVLPSGIGGAFDLGVSELATQTIARARTNQKWQPAGRELAALFAIAGGIGLLFAIVLWLLAPWLTTVFNVSADLTASFAWLLRWTAAGCLILFPTLVIEGIIKGYERYRLLRGGDVGTALAYAAGTLGASFVGSGYEVVAIVFLGASALRGVFLAAYAVRLLHASQVSLLRPTWEIGRNVLGRGWIMMQSRVIGIAGQGPLFSLLIGGLFGPASVGLYDLLVRVPRFSRSALSLFTSALLPVTTRLEERGSAASVARLGRAGMLFWPWVSVPPLLSAAVLSPLILRLWVGPEYAGYGFWMGVMFLAPICAQYLYVGSTMVIGRPAVFQRYNYVMLGQLVFIVVVAASTVYWLHERAFILAQGLGALIILPFQLRLTIREFDLPARPIVRGIALHWATLMVGAAVLLLMQRWGIVTTAWQLVATVAIWCAAEWLMSYFLALSPVDRAEIANVLAAAGVGRRRPASSA